MSNDKLPKGKTPEREQHIFTFRVSQLTQLIWLVFSILEVLLVLRLGLKFVWAIEKVQSLFFDRVQKPLVSGTQTMVSDLPPENNLEKHTSNIALHQQDNDITRPKIIFAGLLLGSLAGVGATLLLAPQSGEKMRAKIQQKGMELSDRASETVEDAVAQVYLNARQLTYDVRQQAEGLKQRSQTILDGQKGS